MHHYTMDSAGWDGPVGKRPGQSHSTRSAGNIPSKRDTQEGTDARRPARGPSEAAAVDQHPGDCAERSDRGADAWTDVQLFGESKRAWLATLLDLTQDEKEAHTDD